MRVLCTAILLFIFTGCPASAQIRYDRMLVACPDLQKKAPLQAFSPCQNLVMGISVGLYRANLYRKGGGFSDLWLKTMLETKQTIARLQQEFPGVWEAQSCPMGDCRDILDQLSPEQRRDFRERFEPPGKKV